MERFAIMLDVKKIILLAQLVALGCSEPIYATTDEQAAIHNKGVDAPPNIGNFALPPPQQPGPLFSFGQTLVGKNILQLNYNTYIDYPRSGGGGGHDAAFIFGFTDSTSVYFDYRIEADYTTRRTHLTNVSDAILQLEHAFYSAGNATYQDQATVVGLITLPLHGSTDVTVRTSKDRLTQLTAGYGAPAYFLGTTFNRTGVNWLGFVSPGFLLTPTSDHIKLGSQAFYEAGIGHNLYSVTNKFILFGLLEFEGQYTEKDNVYGINVPDTGGSIFSLAPSLWLSTRHLILQAGVSFPVVQQLNGNQSALNYSFTGSVSWTIG
jgi:hypothetical protein